MNFIFALTIGVLLAIMMNANGELTTYLGSYLMSFIVHFIGLVLIVITMYSKKEKIKVTGFSYLNYFAGIFGVLTVMLLALSINKIGLTYSVVLSLFSQSLFSLFIDHYGWFNSKVKMINPFKIIGLTIILFGILLVN
jgi:transporter family-2 protein